MSARRLANFRSPAASDRTGGRGRGEGKSADHTCPLSCDLPTPNAGQRRLGRLGRRGRTGDLKRREMARVKCPPLHRSLMIVGGRRWYRVKGRLDKESGSVRGSGEGRLMSGLSWWFGACFGAAAVM